MSQPASAAATGTPLSGAHAAKYRADVDGLRAVAILSVLTFHAFPAAAGGGFVGVDVFFVISGFLISGIILDGLRRDTFTLAGFYARRIRRIFPALVLVLAACWGWGWRSLFADPFAQLGAHIAGGAGFASNFVLWRESGYFDDAADMKPLLHLWSLGIEEQFYLAWPLMLAAAWRRRINVIGLMAIVAAASVAFNVGLTRLDAVAAFYSPLTRVWELAMGGVLAALTTMPPAHGIVGVAARVAERLRTDWRHVASFAGLACIGAAVAFFDRHTSFPGWRALLPTIGAALLLSAGAGAWVNRRVLAHPLMVGVGLISYPLYLWHWPLLAFARVAAAGAPSVGVRAGAVAASVVLAWITYVVCERPIRFGRHGRAAVAVLSVLMAVLLGAGVATYRAEGFVERPVNRSDIAHYLQYYERLHKQGLRDAYRGECDFMDWTTEQTRTEIAAGCTASGPRGTVLLWGDSYAQALSLGLRQALPAGVALAQVATSLCPPRITEPDPLALGGRCARANAYARDAVRSIKPRLVLLAQMGGHESVDWVAMADAIRGLGAERVVVVGPTPKWLPSLPLVITSRYWGRPHDRVVEGLAEGELAADRELKRRLGNAPGLRYVSLVDALCTEAGCRATVPGTDMLVAVDSGHLSPQGSVFVVNAALGAELPR